MKKAINAVWLLGVITLGVAYGLSTLTPIQVLVYGLPAVAVWSFACIFAESKFVRKT